VLKYEGTALPKGRNIVPRKNPVEWINMRAYNFFVCGLKFTKFLNNLRWMGCSWSLAHLLSMSKVVRNRAEFWTFLPSQIFVRAFLPKLVHTFFITPASRLVAW